MNRKNKILAVIVLAGFISGCNARRVWTDVSCWFQTEIYEPIKFIGCSCPCVCADFIDGGGRDMCGDKFSGDSCSEQCASAPGGGLSCAPLEETGICR